MADECIRQSKRELLLALAERLDQVLWCLLTATDPGCNEKARNRAALALRVVCCSALVRVPVTRKPIRATFEARSAPA
jgi:hypothetical protein